MGHDYGVSPSFLSVTPTRDNEAAPGNRLADKHSRLFHGKTLDEWTMIQLWSSKYLGKAIFVCETEAHRDKRAAMAEQYGVELLVRPPQMLHPINDTGGIPIFYGINHVLRDTFYSLIMTPFVVSPCRPPGFFDMMVEAYLRLFPGAPDAHRGELYAMGGHEIDGALFEVGEDSYGKNLGEDYYNKNIRHRFTTTQHWIASTWWYVYWRGIVEARHDLTLHPKIFDIESWTDIHIDTQDHWDWAEYWFAKKILSKGEDCYAEYRATWSGGK